MFTKNKNNISKKSRRIRKKHKSSDVDLVVEEIKSYYSKNDHDEKELFRRVRELETNMELKSSIFGATIGSFLGVFIGFSETLADAIDSFIKYFNHTGIKGLPAVIPDIMLIFFITIGISTVITFSMFLYSKFYLRLWKNDGRNNYLDEKEKDIIISRIENRNKNKHRRPRFRRIR